jgi:hypothetical protein
MVRQLVDSIEFARRGGQNHLTLVKRCAGTVQPQ